LVSLLIAEINNFFQKGTYHIGESFKDGIAFGTEMFVVHIPDRIWRGRYVSLLDSVKSFCIGLGRTITLPFGWVAREKLNVHSRSDMNTFRYDTLVSQIFDPNSYDSSGKVLFETPGKLRVELVLKNEKDMLGSMKEDFDSYMKSVKTAQLEKRKERIAMMQHENVELDKPAILEKVSDMERREEQVAVHHYLDDRLDSKQFGSLAKKIGNLIRAVWVIRTAVSKRWKLQKQNIDDFTSNLNRTRQIMKRINSWKARKISDFTKKWNERNPLIKFIREELENRDLENTQELFLFNKNLEILDSMEYQDLQNETRKVPAETFTWNFRIWRPSKWNIERNENGRYSIDKYNHYTTLLDILVGALQTFSLELDK